MLICGFAVAIFAVGVLLRCRRSRERGVPHRQALREYALVRIKIRELGFLRDIPELEELVPVCAAADEMMRIVSRGKFRGVSLVELASELIAGMRKEKL